MLVVDTGEGPNQGPVGFYCDQDRPRQLQGLGLPFAVFNLEYFLMVATLEAKRA